MEQLAPRLAIAVFLAVAAAATWHVLDNFLVITPPAGCAGPAGSPRVAECLTEFRSARRSLGVMPQQQQDVTAAMLVRVEQQGADAAEEVREAYLELRAGTRGDDLRFQLAAIRTKLSNCVTGFAEFAPGILKTELGTILTMGSTQVKSTVSAAVTIASAYSGYGSPAQGQQVKRQQVAQTVGMRAGQAGAGLRPPVQQPAGLRPWQVRQGGQTAQPGLRPTQAAQMGQTGQAGTTAQAGKLGQAAQGGQAGLRPTRAGQLGQGGNAGLRPTQAGQAAQGGQAAQWGQAGLRPTQAGHLAQGGQTGLRPTQAGQLGQRGQVGLRPTQAGQRGQAAQGAQAGLRPAQAGQAAQGAQAGQHLAVQYSTGLQPQSPAQPQARYQVQAQSEQLAWSQVQPVYDYNEYEYDDPIDGGSDYPTDYYSGAAASGKSEEKRWDYHDPTDGATVAETNAATSKVAATVAAIEDDTLNNRDGNGLDYYADAADAADSADFANAANSADSADFANAANSADSADAADSGDFAENVDAAVDAEAPDSDDQQRDFTGSRNRQLRATDDVTRQASLEGGYHSSRGDRGESADGYHGEVGEVGEEADGYHHPEWLEAGLYEQLKELQARMRGEHARAQQWAVKRRKMLGLPAETWGSDGGEGEGEEGEAGAVDGTRRRGFGVGQWRKRKSHTWRRGLQAQGLQAQGLQAQRLQAQGRPPKSLTPPSAYPPSSPRSARPPPIPAHRSTQRAPFLLATTMGKKTAEHLPTAGHHSPGSLHHAPGTGPAHREKQPNHWGEGKGQGGGGVTRGHHTHLWRNGRRGAHHPTGVGHHKRKRKGGGGSGGGSGGGGSGSSGGSGGSGGSGSGGGSGGGGGSGNRGSFKADAVVGPGEKYNTVEGALGAAPKEGRFVIVIRRGTYRESNTFPLSLPPPPSQGALGAAPKEGRFGALGAAPKEGRFVIFIRAGTYHESIIFRNKGLIMVGEGADKTIITGDKSAGSGSTTYRSATIGTYHESIIFRNKGLIMVGEGADRTIITGSKSAGSGSTTYRSATIGENSLVVARTIISGSKSASSGSTTYRSATIGANKERFWANKERFWANKERFCALGIRFENTAGPQNHQAVAMRASGDRSAFFECAFEANQDTLYVDAGRQYYKDCYIGGTIDFIFGDAAVVIDNPTIVVHKSSSFATTTASGRESNTPTGIVIRTLISLFLPLPPHSSLTRSSFATITASFATITASGRESNTPTGIVIRNAKISVDSGVSEVYLGRPSPLTQPPVPPIPPSPPPSSPFSSFATITASGRESNTPTGIVIRNAKISVDSGVSEVYLGRPWKACARTVFVDSYMPSELERDGWSTWGGDSKGSCVYYAEKGSTGPGNAASRASWVHPGIISDASQFDPEPFVDLSSWLDVSGQNPKW
ncbi:unnamed protein product [Closterium sp. Naga37s-1]|nr:unnamed protein product [Closterium sp. Naga37s-1]